MKFFDAHAHIQLGQFDVDRAEVLERMQAAGMGALVVGTDFETSKAAVELAEHYSFLWAAVGLHPNHIPEEKFDEAAFGKLAQHPKVVAVGECGLDYYRQEPLASVRAAQHERFVKHLELAIAANKPLIVHCRATQGTQNAHTEMFELLSEYKEARVVMHFFTSTKEIAEKYLMLGCYLSFPGPVTFTDMYDEAIAATPLDKLLSETDSPFAAPVPYRGRRNEPVYVQEVVAKIAAVKNLPVEEVVAEVVKNARTVFDIKTSPGVGL